jgi:hypothetical protein
MNNKELIQAYNIIKKIINNPFRVHRSIVRDIIRLSTLEVEDIHHELFNIFLKKTKNTEIKHILTYLDRFCLNNLINLKNYYSRECRAGKCVPNVEYNDRCNYIDSDPEEIIFDLIGKK